MKTTTTRIYAYTAALPIISNGIVRSPFYVLRDAIHPLEESAALAGLVKNISEGLEREVRGIAALTQTTYPQSEEKARLLLEALIDAKRAFMRAEKSREESH